jgi:hypothetical protein
VSPQTLGILQLLTTNKVRFRAGYSCSRQQPPSRLSYSRTRLTLTHLPISPLYQSPENLRHHPTHVVQHQHVMRSTEQRYVSAGSVDIVSSLVSGWFTARCGGRVLRYTRGTNVLCCALLATSGKPSMKVRIDQLASAGVTQTV